METFNIYGKNRPTCNKLNLFFAEFKKWVKNTFECNAVTKYLKTKKFLKYNDKVKRSLVMLWFTIRSKIFSSFWRFFEAIIIKLIQPASLYNNRDRHLGLCTKNLLPLYFIPSSCKLVCLWLSTSSNHLLFLWERLQTTRMELKLAHKYGRIG